MTPIISEGPLGDHGDVFQEAVAEWLARAVPTRAQNQCFDLPAILATDIGLLRQENQDRVAALRFSPRQGGQPIIAVLVSDGMGGMKDGAKCATLAVSSFFHALVRYRHQGLEQRAAAAAAQANDAVYAFAGGRGGATLSGVLFEIGASPVVVNLGDSRIYGCGKGVPVERLTVDDSLEEAVGGHGRDLLQFVGMGAGMQPHIRTVPQTTLELALTTDGIHYIDADTFAGVLYHAPEPKAASDRLLALARWCGGHDNASLALVDLRALSSLAPKSNEAAIQVWDPFGTLAISWLRDISEVPLTNAADTPNVYALPATPSQRDNDRRVRKTTRRTPTNRVRGKTSSKDDVQLEIQIEQSADVKGGDDDSR